MSKPASRPLRLLLASALGLSVLSWIRYAAVGSLAPDRAALSFPLDVLAAAAFVTLVVMALRAHLGVLAWCESGEAPAMRRLFTWGLLLCLASAPMLPLLSNDIFSVLAYSDLALHSEINPLTLPAPGLLESSFFPLLSPRWMSAPCVYGPVQLLYWAPAVALSQEPLVSLAIAKLLALGAALLTLLILRCHCGGNGAAFAVVALCPVLWLEGVGQAHNDVVAAMFLAAALLLARGGGVVGPALALGLAVASKLNTLVPAWMFVVYLARPGPRPLARLRAATVAGSTMAAVVVLSYAPFWQGLDTLRVPLEFLGGRLPTNTLGAVAYHALRQLTDRAAALRLVTGAGSLLTLLALLAASWLAWRARSRSELFGSAAKISLLIVTLAGTVFHPWYLLPCLVLAVELKDPIWRRWLATASTASVLVGGTVLFGWGTLQREAYTIVVLILACWLWLHHLRDRLRRLGA